jgi:hypothetical protein
LNVRDKRRRTRVAIGFTVKSGWACAVLLAGPTSSPRLVDSCRVELSDPAIPEARQPYHAGFGTARSAGPDLQRLVASVEHYGRRSVTRVIERFHSAGHDLRGAGVVVGSTGDPERISNAHIRIHALEGRLFRQVVVDAAARKKLPCSIWRERDLYVVATGHLERTDQALRSTVTELGRTVDGPWRAEQKAAALVAWLVLAGHTSRGTATGVRAPSSR